jgi:hypothetical protein
VVFHDAPTPPEPSLATGAPPPPPASSASVIAAAGLPSRGDLAATSPQRLYALAAASDSTGLLTLSLPDRSLLLHFKRGSPELIDSTHPDDSLGTFLVSQGLATPQQLGLAEAQKARFGGELLPALFGLGLLNPNVAFQRIAARATAILFRALTTERGSFTFAALDLPMNRALPLGNRWALYLEQLRRVPAPDVFRRMQGTMSLPVQRANGVVALDELKLQPQEARALTFFDGVCSLNQLVSEHPMEADVMVRTAWMLSALDAVSFADVPGLARPPPDELSESPIPSVAPAPAAPPRVAAAIPAPPPLQPARPPAASPVRPPPVQVPGPPVRPPLVQASPVAVVTARPPAPPPPPARPASAASGVRAAPPPAARPPARPTAAQSTDVGELEALLEKMRGQSYFDVLGVPRDADAGAVKMAYFRFAKSFHPDTIPQGASEAMVKVKADLFALVGQANRTLSDPQLRSEYLAELDAGGKGEKVDVGQLLLAEELFQRGRNLIKARKYPEAVKALDDAIAANGSEGEYFGWRGYARFFTEPDKARAHPLALRDLEQGLKMNPNAAAVHYFNGFLWKLMGDLGKARAGFKRCVELDPRHVDAQRELRMMK